MQARNGMASQFDAFEDTLEPGAPVRIGIHLIAPKDVRAIC